MDLINSLLHSVDTASEEEREMFKSLLDLTVKNLAHDGELPDDPIQAAAVRSAVACLARLQRHTRNMPKNGLAYRGRPAFLTDELVAALHAEAAGLRATASRQSGYWLAAGGPISTRLAGSAELMKLVAEVAVPVERTDIASIIFYDREGDSIAPHVDTGVFSLNINIMLEHSRPGGERRSRLMLMPADGEPEQLLFEPGEMLVMYADCVVHGRTRLAAGEYVNCVTIGFQPTEWSCP